MMLTIFDVEGDHLIVLLYMMIVFCVSQLMMMSMMMIM